MVPLPTHITMRAYAGPFDALRSQICEGLYLTLYWYSRPRGVGKAKMISQISSKFPRISSIVGPDRHKESEARGTDLSLHTSISARRRRRRGARQPVLR